MQSFRRYTNLADLIYIIREKRITLRDPQRWDDRNDSYYLKKYKESKNLETLLALCFADRTGETYHHWRVFSDGADGVSIRLNKDCILDAFRKKCKKDRVDPLDRCVKYVKIGELQRNPPCVEDLPFLKWSPYGDEREYRIIYASGSRRDNWGFDIELQWIEHISLGPWLPELLEKSLVKELRSISGCPRIGISRSRVIDFGKWQAVANNVVGEAPGSPRNRAESFDPIQLAGAWPGDEPLETLLAKLD